MRAPYNQYVLTAAVLMTTHAAVTLVADDAFAQTELTSSILVGDPIVVSAGREKVASDTPQSVTVIDQEQIDREQATTIGDLFDEVPGVTATGTDRILGERFNIRGFGGSSFDGGDERRIILQVDGATKFYQQYRLGALFTDPELYKRVEVLRGPASSTLYGSGALAGVITLETKDASDFLDPDDPEDTFAFRQKLEGSTNGEGFLTSTIVAFQPLDNVELLAAFNYRDNDGVEDGSGNLASGSAFEAPSGLLKARVSFGDDNAHTVWGSYQHWTTQEDGADYEQTSTGSAAFGLVDREVTDQTVILGYEYMPTNNDLIDLDVRFSYSNTEVEQENATNPFFIPSTLFEDADYAYRTFQGRVENTFTFGSEESFETFLTVGVQASRQRRIGEAANSGFIAFQPGGTDTKLAAYAQAEIIFPFGLTVIPGLRVERSSLEPDSLNTSFTQDVANTAVSPKLAVLFELTDTINVFGSVAYTERLPVLDEVFDGASGNLNLEPETALNFEAGASYSSTSIFMEDDVLAGKITFFNNDVENLIDRANTASPYRNVNESQIYGVEVEGRYDSEYFFSSLAATAIRGEDKTANQPLTSIPADQLSLTLGGRIPEYGVTAGVRSLFVMPQDDLPIGQAETPGYQVYDFFASWQPDQGLLDGFEARIGIENLLDTTYRNHLSADNARGRTYRLTVAKTF